ncbi:hypothetical protein [Halorarum halobium]|uniref:hypothetical protein n=1 Tax=Halorarum halobium TaxID=3075121 RepID=UPI0028A9ABFB|nr:hypothetical protein [Halobaculum sp. XH14]
MPVVDFNSAIDEVVIAAYEFLECESKFCDQYSVSDSEEGKEITFHDSSDMEGIYSVSDENGGVTVVWTVLEEADERTPKPGSIDSAFDDFDVALRETSATKVQVRREAEKRGIAVGDN